MCLNYEEGEIQIFHVSKLDCINKVFTISFSCNEICTLQFIDNLILLHNFEKCETTVIDLKSENSDKILFKKYPMTNYEIFEHNKYLSKDLIAIKFVVNDNKLKTVCDCSLEEGYEVGVRMEYNYIETISMMGCANYFLYERNIKVRGNIIEEVDYNNRSTFYEVYFDPLVYLENTRSKHEAVFHLIRRSHSKDVIIHALYEMIKSQNSMKIIKVIFNKLVKQLQKCLYNQQLLGLTHQVKQFSGNLRGSLLPSQSASADESAKSPDNLPIPTELIWLRKRTIVKQNDIFENLLKAFDYSKIVKPDYILKILVHYANSLISFNIPIQPCFNGVVVKLIKKIQNFALVTIFLQYHSIYDSFELAKYLIDEASISENGDPSALQLGLDMLIRLKHYPEAFATLLKNKRLVEAIAFSRRYKISLDSISPRNLRRLKKLAEENMEMVTQFLSSNSKSIVY